jgi:hypothetical protein
VAELEKLKILCGEWLYKNFRIKGEVTETVILKQENITDIELGWVGVAFEFQCPDGKTGDSVAFFDKNLVEETLIDSQDKMLVRAIHRI